MNKNVDLSMAKGRTEIRYLCATGAHMRCVSEYIHWVYIRTNNWQCICLCNFASTQTHCTNSLRSNKQWKQISCIKTKWVYDENKSNCSEKIVCLKKKKNYLYADRRYGQREFIGLNMLLCEIEWNSKQIPWITIIINRKQLELTHTNFFFTLNITMCLISELFFEISHYSGRIFFIYCLN